MTALHDPGCTISRSNTGSPSCDFKPGNIIWACLIPKAIELSAAEVASSAAFITKMQAMVIAAPTVRAFPIGKLDNPKDSSEEPLFEKSAYGNSIFVRDGKYVWELSIVDGGLGLLGNLMAFNNTKAYKIIFADSQNFIFGTKSTAVTGGMKGLEIDSIYFKPWKMSDGSKGTAYTFTVTLSDPSELNQDVEFLKLDSDPDESIKGCIDVVLELGTLTPASKISIKVIEKYSRINLYGLYSTLLNDENAWVVTKAGAAVTPASHALVAAEEAVEITLTTPAGAHVFSLAAPAALDTLGIGGPPDNGFESNTLSATFVQP
jgi:hypothetical protein